MKGAEAVVSDVKIIGISAVKKSRQPKSYRVKELDEKLRLERTRSEARLLHKAKLAGIDCPTVLEVTEFDLIMTKISGKRPNMDKEVVDAGKILAKLHRADIIHGDYTSANLILSNARSGESRVPGEPDRANVLGKSVLTVIDFGLGFISNDIEDKAVDVFTMLRTLARENQKKEFVKGYSVYEKAAKVLDRVKEVEKRVRYAF